MKIHKHLEKLSYIGISLTFFAGYYFQSPLMLTLAMYALSGAATNSLAILMIFHKIPGLLGSGIIEKNFYSFQQKLKTVIMEHFFKNGLSFDSFNTELIGRQLYEKIAKSDFAILTQFMNQEKMIELLESMNIKDILSKSLKTESIETHLEEQIMQMSPEEIKNLILHIMHEHLQYLVVWGAIFGALMGYAAYHLL
jgi:uncharacterized membrane protein YheB (UPF0754 family)